MIQKDFITKYGVILPFFGVLILAFPFFQYPKGDVVLMMNQAHNPFWNWLFTSLSSLGNALSIFLFLGIVLWKYNLKSLYFFVLAFLLESLVIIVAKNMFYSHVPRPYLFFETQGILDQIDFVEGIKVNKRRSFPSGHTAYSFCIAVFFAFKIDKTWTSVSLAIIAAFIGMSRIYLVQHFFMDVFMGAIVGITTSGMAYFLVFKTERKWYGKRIFPKKENSINLNNESFS